MTGTAPRKRKIAIVGGGMAGLATAFELSKTPEQRARYDVTVYQMGWRLGGKLASGRNLEVAQRNQEHGLHVWLGFYENAFGLVRDVYDQIPKASTDAFTQWDQAFAGQDYTPIGEQYGSKWTYWGVDWPTNGDQPGLGKVELTPWGAVTELCSALERLVGVLLAHPRDPKAAPVPGTRLGDAVRGLFEHAVADVEAAAELPIAALAARIVRWAQAFEGDHRRYGAAHHAGIAELVRLLAEAIERHVEGVEGEHPAIRGIYHVLVIGMALTRGMLDPKWRILETEDLSVVDGIELRDFLKQNGGTPAVIDGASELRAFYDLAFAYEGGRLERPNIAAGTAIRDILRIVVTMKGHVLYLPQAGFGEAVISPLYRVLAQNGVRFEFFHRLTRLELGADRASVARLHFAKQAQTADGQPYEPVRYDAENGTWWWPAEPFWDRLVDGEAMKKAGVDFECKWRQPPSSTPVVRAAGTDFDDVVLAVAHGAFKRLNAEPTPCDELYAACPAFAAAIDAQGCVPTQSLQLWTKLTLAGLGFDGPKPAMVAAPELLDVWADMSQTIAFEHWPKDAIPGFVAYVCAILPTDLYAAPSTDRDVPTRARKLVLDAAIAYYERYTGWMWPKATAPGRPDALDYDVLVAPAELSGPARLDAQWVRANVEPTECCVASLTGTTRLRPGARGPANDGGAPPAPWFLNLYFAGDWTRSVVDTVCVEGAVSSAKAAARAISGQPEAIPGEDFFFGARRL